MASSVTRFRFLSALQPKSTQPKIWFSVRNGGLLKIDYARQHHQWKPLHSRFLTVNRFQELIRPVTENCQEQLRRENGNAVRPLEPHQVLVGLLGASVILLNERTMARLISVSNRRNTAAQMKNFWCREKLQQWQCCKPPRNEGSQVLRPCWRKLKSAAQACTNHGAWSEHHKARRALRMKRTTKTTTKKTMANGDGLPNGSIDIQEMASSGRAKW